MLKNYAKIMHVVFFSQENRIIDIHFASVLIQHYHVLNLYSISVIVLLFSDILLLKI